MRRSTGAYVATGALVFALGGALFGFVWTRFEFPYVMALQWALGLGALGWLLGGRRDALRAGIVGALVFLVVWLLSLFVAIAVFEFPVPTAVAATLTAAVVGAVLDRGRGALVLGTAALVGFVLGDLALAGLASVSPEGTEQPGLAQALWFAFGQAVAGLLGGAGLGFGFARLASKR